MTDIVNINTNDNDSTPDVKQEEKKKKYTYTYTYDPARIKKYNTTWKSKEKNKEYHKEYYKKNKSKFIEKHICTLCGASFTIGSKYQHLKSKRHTAAVEVPLSPVIEI